MRYRYPLMLDLSDRLAVIIGGGAVAARKAAGLLEAGAARVRVVAPTFHPEMPAAVLRVSAAYEPHHLDGASLVFAATDSADVNERVVRDARARGALVNRADAAEGGSDFITPAKFQEGELIVTVSAGSPALAVVIRDDLARRLDPRHARMADAMGSLRPAILQSTMPPDQRQQAFRDLASDAALEALAADGPAGLRRWLAARYPLPLEEPT